ncbi:MAG: DUF4375 domain-containing protein [Terricaulis sp.]
MDAEAFWDRLYAMRVSEMTDAERQCFAVNWFLCEWANGFLEQYFYNSGGDQFDALVEGLTAIGAVEAVAILKQAKLVLFENYEVREESLPWPLPDEKREALKALDAKIAAQENAIWDGLESFAVAERLCTPGD